MICVICREAEVVEALTAIEFEAAEFKFEVTDVPARTCPNCGEAFVDEVVAEQTLRIVRQASDAGTSHSEGKYETL